MQNLSFRILLVLLTYTALHAQTENDVLRNFIKVYPDKSAVFDSLRASELGDIIFYQLSSSYDISAVKSQIQRYNLQISLADESYIPFFNVSAGIQGYNSYDRLVNVNARVPVEWDNRNPIKTDYRLPNGGRGIMWIPRPLRWEEHSIDLQASTAYQDLLQSYNMGFNYRTSYGLSISALNLSLRNRVFPKAYGYPWSAVLSNNFELPVFKNAGTEGSSIETEKKINKINIDIAKTNSAIISNNISYETIRNYFRIYFLWNKLKILGEIISLTEVQMKDQSILTEKNLISVYDRLRIEKEYRQMLSQKEELLFEYISSCAKLNPTKVFNSQDIYLYIPCIDSVQAYIESFENYLMRNYLNGNADKLVYDHPELFLSAKTLEQAKVNLSYSLNQHKPEISITGNMAVFESDELGYGNIHSSLLNLFRKPDGIAWSVGLSYRFSLFSSPESVQRQIAVEDYQERQKNMERTKDNIKQQADDFMFRLKSSHLTLNSAKSNLNYSQNIMKEGEELFSIQRISRFDYNEYKKSGLSERINVLNVYDSQIELLIQFMQFAGIKPALVVGMLKDTDNKKRQL